MNNLINYVIILNMNSNVCKSFEYISTIVSILLATVAIWATIYTTRKQNKTAMFEKRLEVFRLINFILDFYLSIYDFDYEITSEDEKCDDLFKYLMDQNKMIYIIWVNQRLIYSQTCHDDIRLDLYQRAIKGNRDRELHDIMLSYLLYDLNVLQQGEYIFKGKISKTIEKTKNTYYNLIDNLLMIPNGNGTHSIDYAKKYYNDFEIVCKKWENPKIKKRLKKDMNII